MRYKLSLWLLKSRCRLKLFRKWRIFYRMVSATIARLQKYLMFLVLKCYYFAVMDGFLEDLTQEKGTDVFKWTLNNYEVQLCFLESKCNYCSRTRNDALIFFFPLFYLLDKSRCALLGSGLLTLFRESTSKYYNKDHMGEWYVSDVDGLGPAHSWSLLCGHSMGNPFPRWEHSVLGYFLVLLKRKDMSHAGRQLRNRWSETDSKAWLT